MWDSVSYHENMLARNGRAGARYPGELRHPIRGVFFPGSKLFLIRQNNNFILESGKWSELGVFFTTSNPPFEIIMINAPDHVDYLTYLSQLARVKSHFYGIILLHNG